MRSPYNLNIPEDIPNLEYRREEDNYLLYITRGDEWIEQWKVGDFIFIAFDGTGNRYFYEVKAIRDKDILLVFSTMFVYSHTDKGLVWCDMLDNGKIYEMQEDK